MKEMTFAAKLDNIPVVTDFIEAELEAVDCPMKIMMQIDMAVDEIFTNIASYAYVPGEGDATVRFDFDADRRVVSICFIDSGVPFDPLAKEDPDVTLSAQERPIGGLGIFMVKKSMTDVRYEYVDGKNQLTLFKQL